jgi:GrpB-like predicted nucleotidyltransferase (UPF0157 family)
LPKNRSVGVPAVVVSYDPGWPGLFRQLRDRVDAALAGVPHETEHVGSTAVPGLDAKPIIDLDVVIADDAGIGATVRALTAAGWQHQGNLGIAGREAFLPPTDAVYHHLYAVVAGSQPHSDHIDLRDFLRTHPEQAARYGRLKRQLATLLETDRPAYSDGKAEMITEFLRQARCSAEAPLPVLKRRAGDSPGQAAGLSTTPATPSAGRSCFRLHECAFCRIPAERAIVYRQHFAALLNCSGQTSNRIRAPKRVFARNLWRFGGR